MNWSACQRVPVKARASPLIKGFTMDWIACHRVPVRLGAARTTASQAPQHLGTYILLRV